MDIVDVEDNLFVASDAKLHGDMCKKLSTIYCKIMSIFPSLEAAQLRSKSGIQALCLDYVLTKFEKARCALQDGLRCVDDIVPQSIGSQILEIVSVLEVTVFALDPLEKQVGDDIIALLQQERKFDNCNDSNELESFHQATTKLGITSSKAVLVERRALSKLIERARAEEDKRKDSILFRNEFSDDNDSKGSAPCSPTVRFKV
ncbi:hypothetical protein UlMin_012390 [Ulmus minor]